MAETTGNNPLATGSEGAGDAPDLESLDDSAGTRTGQDSMLNAAHVFEAQLEQMTAWKHQLAQQMELLRRDGVKLLERQKNLALERQKLATERDSIAGDRASIQKLHADLDEQTKRLAEEGARIERGMAELKGLEAQKARWEQELATARSAAQAAAVEAQASEKQRAELEGRLAEAARRVSDIEALEKRGREIEQQVAAAESRLAGLRKESDSLENMRQQLSAREVELGDTQSALATRQQQLTQQAAQLDAANSQLEEQRRALASAQQALGQERQQLEHRRRDLDAGAETARHAAERDRAQAAEQTVESRTTLDQLNEARARQDQRWTALEARSAEVAAAEETIQATTKDLAERDERLRTQKHQLDEAQGRLLGEQEELMSGEQALAQKIAAAEAEIQARLNAAAQTRQQAQEERQLLQKQREELDKKLSTMEGELAEQFEAIARQTKRLTERRADVEARSGEVEAEVEKRIAQASDALHAELAQAKENYEKRALVLQAQVDKAQNAASAWRTRETELEASLATAEQERAALRTELAHVSEELNESSNGRTQQAALLAEQVMRFERESAEWQRKLERTAAEAGQSDQLKAAVDAAESARAQVDTLRLEIEQLGVVKKDLENRLAAQARSQAQAQKQAEELAARLQAADAQLAASRESYEAAKRGAGRKAPAADLEKLQQQLKTFEQQRDDLAAQLFNAQDALRREAESSLLARNNMDAQIQELRQINQTLEAEKITWQKRDPEGGPPSGAPLPADTAETRQAAVTHRARLLRQARALRALRAEANDHRSLLEQGREEIARHREQLRTRKENLEQVKRLLEKQEMVMARKLADHSALKTVAAVGIFLIMILGSVFFGVYKFVAPTYRGEAMVQLAPPAGQQGAELQAWCLHQAEVIRSHEVTFAAWKILRGGDQHYTMDDVREEWLATLDKNLSTQFDGAGRTLAIHYTGRDAEGVAQVCNALAIAYVTPATREPPSPQGPGAGANILTRADPAGYPAQDHRMVLSLSISACAMLISLVLVMMVRYYVARQLREIDEMADAQDLAELKGDIATG